MKYEPPALPAPFMALLDAAAVPALACDAHGTVCLVSAAWDRLDDKAMSTAQDQSLSALATPDDAPRVAAYFADPDRRQLDLSLGDPAAPVPARLIHLPGATGGFDICILRMADVMDATEQASWKQRELRWRTALDCAGHAVWDTWNPDGTHYISDNWFTIRGFDSADDVGGISDDWMNRVHPEDRPRLEDAHRRQARGETDQVSYEYRYENPDGDWVWISSRGRVLTRDANGAPKRVVGVDTNITEYRNLWENYDDVARRLDLSLESSGIGTWQFRRRDGVTFWDDRMLAIYGISDGNNIRASDEWPAMLHPDDRDRILQISNASVEEGRDLECDYRVIRKDGKVRNVRSRAKCIRDDNGQTVELIGVNIDLTEDLAKTEALEAARAALEHESRHDPLTGLPNRRRLDEYHAQILQRAADAGEPPAFAVLHVDLDHFKEVNDRLGHAAGDALLRQTANVMSDVVGKAGLVARYGGDEFMIVLPGTQSDATLNDLAYRLKSATSDPFVHAGRSCRYGLSIGMARHDPASSDTDAAFADADLALYAAKEAGRNCARHFEPQMRDRADKLRLSRADILAALQRGEFVPHYQPQYCARTGKVRGVEALARWQRPDGTLRSPDQFLDAAEATGLIRDVDQHILSCVLRDLVQWEEAGLSVPRVSVNVSAGRLVDPDLPQSLDDLSIPPGQLCFELLETAYLDEDEGILLKNLAALRARDIAVEIDDFGSGHASFISFLRVAPTGLKIDRGLIMPIVASDEQRQIVKAIADIGHMRKAAVIAEGVETRDHAIIAASLGCDILQGYAYARPMPADALLTHLRRRAIVTPDALN